MLHFITGEITDLVTPEQALALYVCHPNDRLELAKQLFPDSPIPTNDPYVFGRLSSSQGKVEIRWGGRTKLLSEHPEWAEWKAAMELGQLWAYFGIKWILEED